MSLLGKILALLNMLGAVGLVCVAMLDYGKRQTWAFSYFRHELTLNGLPVDDKEHDAQNKPIVDRLGEDLPREMFKDVGNNPVSTQTQEVQRIQQLIDGKIQQAQSKPQQIYLLARVLLPFADNYLEREQLLACRAHFATDATVAALKKRCEDALRDALRPASPDLPAKSFSESYRMAFRAQGGPAAGYFVSLILAERDKAPAKTIDSAYEAALETQRVALQNRYTQVFADALGTTQTLSDTPSSMASQKAAIARLMFAVSPFLAEEEILTDPAREDIRKNLTGPPDRPAYQQALIESPPYRLLIRRTYVVCGLRASLDAISERAAVLRRLGAYAQNSIAVEWQQFGFDHAAILDQLRDLAAVVREEQLKIAGNEKRLEDYSEVVRRRTKEIEDLEGELKKSRSQTTIEIDRLRETSENVLQMRERVRDAIRDNELGERRIRELEKKVRDLEK